jgi:hypothetical protein
MHAGSNEADPSTITCAKTVISSGCTIMAQSIVSAGTTLPPSHVLTPGTTSARPAAGPCSAEEHWAVRTEPKRLPALLWLSSTAILILVFSFMWLAVVPTIGLWYYLNLEDNDTWRDLLEASLNCFVREPEDQPGVCRELWWSELVAMLLLPPTTMAMSMAYMWLMVPIKWILVGHITEHKMQKGENDALCSCSSALRVELCA